jgi:hypothetical protein
MADPRTLLAGVVGAGTTSTAGAGTAGTRRTRRKTPGAVARLGELGIRADTDMSYADNIGHRTDIPRIGNSCWNRAVVSMVRSGRQRLQ